MIPRFDSVWPIRAVSSRIRRWQAMAISPPPPVAWPFTAAITGLGKRSLRRTTPVPNLGNSSRVPPENAEPRSAPPQKILSPAPVIITERTLESFSSSVRAASRSRISCSLIALAGGRFSVMTAYDSSRVRISVSDPMGILLGSLAALWLGGQPLQEDIRHGLGGLGEL